MILSPNEVAMLAVNGFGAMQKPAEFAALLTMLEAASPRTILEIGVGKAGSSWAFSKIEALERIVAIDLPGGPWGGGPTEESIKYIADNSPIKYDFIAGNSMSSECLEAVKKLLFKSFDKFDEVDFLFIDGDHSYSGVKTDFLTYKQFVREGGLIAFHDICEHAPETGCEVKKFWDEIKESTPKDKYVEFISEPTNWGGIGVLKV